MGLLAFGCRAYRFAGVGCKVFVCAALGLGFRVRLNLTNIRVPRNSVLGSGSMYSDLAIVVWLS